MASTAVSGSLPSIVEDVHEYDRPNESAQTREILLGESLRSVEEPQGPSPEG